MDYRQDLDGLRCLAVLLVLVFHFDLFGIGEAGFMGVDMFFVLSGFLITTISWGQLNKGTFSLGRFYVRRLRRLSPALIAVQVLLLAFAAIRLLPSDTLALSWQSIATQGYFINIFLWRNVDYFGLQAAHVPFLHCWSLAIEEQFYLFHPLALMLIHRWNPKRFWIVLGVFATLSFALNLVLVQTKPWATFYLLPTRAWELLLGGLAGGLVPFFSTRLVWRNVSAALGVVLIGAALVTFNPSVPFPGAFALLPALGTVGLILAGSGEGSWLSSTLCFRPFVYVGKISYSLYLVHWPLRVFGLGQIEGSTHLERWVFFCASFVLAAALYHSIEDPIRRGALLPRTKQALWFYGVSAVGIVLVSVSSVVSGGWRQRYTPDTLALMDHREDRDKQRLSCEMDSQGLPQTSELCQLGKKGTEPTWFIYGDSHAYALAEAASLAFEEHGVASYFAFSHGCLPVLDLQDEKCRAFNRAVHAELETIPNVKNVLLVSIWRQAAAKGIIGPEGTFLENDDVDKAFQRQFTTTLDALHAMGKQVFVWAPLPAAPDNVPQSLARERAFGVSANLDYPVAEHEKTFAFLKRAFQSNHERIERVVSPIDLMCPKGTCSFDFGGTPLFTDNNHPAFSAAPRFARVFSEQLFERSPAKRLAP